MKNNSVANTLAATIAISYVTCVIFVLLVPDLYLFVMQSWFHGVDLAKISYVNITTENFLTGLVTITAAAWAIGYLFTYIHNLLAKK